MIDFAGITNRIDSSPIIGSSGIYLIDMDGSLLALDHDGSIVWRYATLDVFAPPSIGANGALYFGAKNSNRFYALNSDGSVRWIKKPGVGNYTTPAIGSDGTIYVSDSAGMYALDTSGNRIWEFDAPMGSPVIAGAHVYAASDLLYAFDAMSDGPAMSSWPMRNASARNDSMAIVLPAPPQFDRASLSYQAGGLILRASAQSGARVGLYSSSDLKTWNFVKDQIAVNGNVDFENVTATAGSQFYRAQLE